MHSSLLLLQLLTPYRCPRVDIIKIVEVSGTFRFCRLRSVANVAQLRFIRGPTIGVSLVDNINIPSLVRWSDRSVEKLQARPDIQVRISRRI